MRYSKLILTDFMATRIYVLLDLHVDGPRQGHMYCIWIIICRHCKNIMIKYRVPDQGLRIVWMNFCFAHVKFSIRRSSCKINFRWNLAASSTD